MKDVARGKGAVRVVRMNDRLFCRIGVGMIYRDGCRPCHVYAPFTKPVADGGVFVCLHHGADAGGACNIAESWRFR